MATKYPPAIDRFWDAVVFEPMSGCWLWTRYITGGYGRFTVNGKMVAAHRFSYELHKGQIPEGLVLDHLCRNRACVNPDHLQPVTHQENLLRGIGPTGTNARKQACVHGHPYTPENTLYIRNGRNRMCRECGKARGRERYWASQESRERDNQKCRDWWAKNRAKGVSHE